MEYKTFDQTIVMRLNIGDEIVASIMEVAKLEHIKLASISAIGAVDELTIGVFKPDEQKYYAKQLTGDFELLALNGNITVKDDEPYVHLHITIGDEAGNAFGGHLNEAFVSATAEIFITVIDGTVNRKVDPITTLNIFDFK